MRILWSDQRHFRRPFPCSQVAQYAMKPQFTWHSCHDGSANPTISPRRHKRKRDAGTNFCCQDGRYLNEQRSSTLLVKRNFGILLVDHKINILLVTPIYNPIKWLSVSPPWQAGGWQMLFEFFLLFGPSVGSLMCICIKLVFTLDMFLLTCTSLHLFKYSTVLFWIYSCIVWRCSTFSCSFRRCINLTYLCWSVLFVLCLGFSILLWSICKSPCGNFSLSWYDKEYIQL